MTNDKLILIPGLDGTALLFRDFIECAPECVEVVPLELPNEPTFNYSDYADYVATKIGYSPVTIVAESFGGMVAYELLRKHPDLVQRIVFVASFITVPSIVSRLSGIAPISLVKSKLVPEWFLNFLLFKTPNPRDKISLLRKAINQVDIETLKSRLKLIRSIKPLNVPITKPCSYIQPDSDFLVSKRAYQRIEKISVDFELKTVNGGHFILQSNPEKCWEAICETLSK